MKIKITNSEWWGAPKKFNTEDYERRITWLELFYDLVYVLVIAKLTHNLSHDLSWHGLIDYCFFFTMVFWSWLNGSLYHDLHGAEGLRTRLMTLWQILIAAALIITLGNHSETFLRNNILCLIIMQVFITYQWWSIGIYDPLHRRLNRPYTIFFLISLSLLFAGLFIPSPLNYLFLFTALILNLAPPFLLSFIVKRESMNLQISRSMTERLGQVTIILFGEVIAGVINGAGSEPNFSLKYWLNFVLAIAIVFALWWLFFTLVSDRKCKRGFLQSSTLELIYVPTLIALGLLGLGFYLLFTRFYSAGESVIAPQIIIGGAIALFFFCIFLISYLLEYPEQYQNLKKRVQFNLFVFAIFFSVLITILSYLKMPLFGFLLLVLTLIIIEITYLNYLWYAVYSQIESNKKALTKGR